MPNPSSLSASAAAWAPGMAVARYQLVAPIATGGMAEIWLARQPGVQNFDRVVVVKRLINSLESDNDHIEMFLTEARLAAQLNHPNVVQIFELGEYEGSFFIAMEYLDGENLATVRTAAARASRALSYPLAARLVTMAAEGLQYAHTRTSFDGKPLPIVHRDVSPQNLIVTYEGGLKLVDFGIAKVATEATTSGKLKGKIRYMPPEQGRAEQLDERADIFSLGMVLFEVVTNTRMFPRMDELELLKNVISDEPLPRARTRRPDMPPRLDAIIAKALERKPDNRFSSAREMQNALEEYLRLEARAIGSTEISAFMKSLFADRMAERRRLIESAMAGQINPALVPETFRGPSVTMGGRARASRTRRLRAAAAAIVLGGFSLGMILGKPERAAAPPAPVQLAAPILDIDTDPAGASLEVDSVDRGTAPVTISDLSGGEHKITARKEHFVSTTRIVTLAPGERLRFVLPLAAEPAPAVVVAPVPPAPAPVAVKKRGKLNLSTKPWTTVFYGQTKLGETPITGLSLPAGKQTLHLVNPERQIDTMVEIEIRAGETTNKKLRL